MRIRKFRTVSVFLVSSFALYTAILLFSPLPITVIDVDGSGVVSLAEAMGAIDIGKKEIAETPNCIEYFWLKDGMSAYIDCPHKLQ